MAEHPPQPLCHRPVGERGRPVHPGLGRRHMGHHHGGDVPPFIGDPLQLLHFLHGFVRHGQALVAVLLRVAMPRKMLIHGHNPLREERLRHIISALSVLLRVVGKRPGSDDRILRVGVHIGHRCKIHMEAIFPQVRANGVPHLGSILGGRGARVPLQIEPLCVGEPCHAAAFLIHGKEQRDPLETGHIPGERFQLIGALDILSENHNSSHGVFFQGFPHGVRYLRHARRVRSLSAGQGLRADHEQLPHFLLQGHARQHFLCGGFLPAVVRARGGHRCLFLRRAPVLSGAFLLFPRFAPEGGLFRCLAFGRLAPGQPAQYHSDQKKGHRLSFSGTRPFSRLFHRHSFFLPNGSGFSFCRYLYHRRAPDARRAFSKRNCVPCKKGVY